MPPNKTTHTSHVFVVVYSCMPPFPVGLQIPELAATQAASDSLARLGGILGSCAGRRVRTHASTRACMDVHAHPCQPGMRRQWKQL